MGGEITGRIKGTEWKKWGSRRVSLRLAEHWALCTLRFPKFFKMRFPEHLFLIENDVCHGYLEKKQLDVCLNDLLKGIYRSSFTEFYEKKANIIFSRFLAFCKKIPKLPLKRTRKEDLLILYDKFIEEEDNFTNFAWVVFILDDFISKKLEEKLKIFLKEKRQEDRLQDYLNIILSPEKKSAVFLQTIDVLKIADKIKNKRISGAQIGKEMERMEKKYGYFNVYNLDESPLSRDYFRSEIKKMLSDRVFEPKKEIARINARFEANRKEYSKLSRLFKKDRKLSILAESCHKISYYRDRRNDIRREGYYSISRLYAEIAACAKTDLTSLIYMNRDEIRETLKKGKPAVSRGAIEKRKEYSCAALINGKMEYIFDPVIVSGLIESINPKIEIDEFKGLAASPGKITGRVKVIFNTQKDASKLGQGDILVTSMTNLDFVPLMSRASAIVTDEGGLLCHAAIVSREMKKPCIVGTAIATKALKDNDLVEVNANHGFVKMIKRAQ